MSMDETEAYQPPEFQKYPINNRAFHTYVDGLIRRAAKHALLDTYGIFKTTDGVERDKLPVIMVVWGRSYLNGIRERYKASGIIRLDFVYHAPEICEAVLDVQRMQDLLDIFKARFGSESAPKFHKIALQLFLLTNGGNLHRYQGRKRKYISNLRNLGVPNPEYTVASVEPYVRFLMPDRTIIKEMADRRFEGALASAHANVPRQFGYFFSDGLDAYYEFLRSPDNDIPETVDEMLKELDATECFNRIRALPKS